MSWYNIVSNDVSRLDDSINYFESEYITAKSECRITGIIEKASAELPGIVEVRYCQLQEIEAILEFLNIELKHLKSFHFRKYLETYNRALSSRDCDRFVEGEADVADFEKIINRFALVRNKFLGLTKSLDNKNWQLSNIIRLRCAGMEDAHI